MNRDIWLMILALVVVAALAGASWQEGRIGDREAEVVQREEEVAALEAQVAELTEELRPPPYCPPLEPAWVSSGVGYRMDPMGGDTESLHKGVDLVGPVGAPVRAVLSGTVAEHWLVPGIHGGKLYRGHPVFGAYIVLDHGGGLFSCYGHLSATYVHEGWQVETGQVIGALGDTGIATGVHLHFEVVVDPLRYLEQSR